MPPAVCAQDSGGCGTAPRYSDRRRRASIKTLVSTIARKAVLATWTKEKKKRQRPDQKPASGGISNGSLPVKPPINRRLFSLLLVDLEISTEAPTYHAGILALLCRYDVWDSASLDWGSVMLSRSAAASTMSNVGVGVHDSRPFWRVRIIRLPLAGRRGLRSQNLVIETDYRLNLKVGPGRL